jgi:hypothetical protein
MAKALVCGCTVGPASTPRAILTGNIRDLFLSAQTSVGIVYLKYLISLLNFV